MLRTITFRLTIMVSLAFTGCVLALFGFIFWQTNLYEMQRLQHVVLAGLHQLATHPVAALPRELDSWQITRPDRLTGAALFGPRGERLGGVLMELPSALPVDGRVHRVTGMVVGGHPDDLLAAAWRLPGGDILVVQRSLALLEELRFLVVRTFLLGVIPLAGLGFAAGTVLSLRTVRRLRLMHEAIDRIMAGDLLERLPESRAKDDLDRLTRGLNKMLDEIGRLIGELKSVGDNIAHDLRTPLTRMRMRLELGREAVQTPEQAGALINACLADLDQTLSLAAALLRIAEIEARRRRVGFGDVDMQAITEEVCEIYAPIAAERGQTLTSVAAPVRLILGDHDLLVEAVANLIDNALKFSPPNGAIRVEVADTADGPLVRVDDDGPGVDRQERDLVLRRFYRGDKSRSVPGFGLGLNLVNAIVELHSFRLVVESGPGGHFMLDCRKVERSQAQHLTRGKHRWSWRGITHAKPDGKPA